MSTVNFGEFNGKCLAGNISCLAEDKAYPVFDPIVLSFFDEVSKFIRKAAISDRFSDIQTFAFFCRRASLKRHKAKYQEDDFRLGWGRSAHVAPANVPVNLAFTLLFGLLSGNKCVVRAPTQPFVQLNFFYNALNCVLQRDCFAELANRFAVISCEYSDPYWLDVLGTADTRVIWGGDDTIQEIRRTGGASKCIELAFPDRTSFCVIDASKLIEIEHDELNRLSEKFFNDTLLMDQNACSSPIQVFWLNADGFEDEIVRFWDSLANAEHRLGSLGVKKYIDKLTEVGRLVSNKKCLSLNEYGLGVLVDSSGINYDASGIRLGYFCQYKLREITQLLSYISKRTQTVTYFGVDPNLIAQALMESGVSGVDRIVPIGNALDLGFVWDGKDIINTLSRQISIK